MLEDYVAIHIYILSAMLFGHTPGTCVLLLFPPALNATASSHPPQTPLNLWSNKCGSLIRKTVQSARVGVTGGVAWFHYEGPPVQFKGGSYVLGWANMKEGRWRALDLSKGGEGDLM